MFCFNDKAGTALVHVSQNTVSAFLQHFKVEKDNNDVYYSSCYNATYIKESSKRVGESYL